MPPIGRCVICRDETDAETSVPCSFCAGWFHLARNSTTAGRNCGRRSLNFLQDGVCGTLYLCRQCDDRLAAGAPPAESDRPVWSG
jgi:hypothetical protein